MFLGFHSMISRIERVEAAVRFLVNSKSKDSTDFGYVTRDEFLRAVERQVL